MEIDIVIERLSKKASEHKREVYMGDDGFYHCAVCKSAVQLNVEFLGIQKTVWCICKCEEREMQAQKERMRREEHERRRAVCFAESNMAKWTFANDDCANPMLSNAMKRYADNFNDYLKNGKGLLMMGQCGTGKSYFACCIANQLIDNGYRVLVTNFARLSNQLQGMFDGKQAFIDSLQRYDLLVLDDLGAERKSEYMQEMVWNIVDARYRSGLPFIVTTNMTMDELYKPDDVGRSRIYDRIIERCFPVNVTGESRRKRASIENFNSMKKSLGL